MGLMAETKSIDEKPWRAVMRVSGEDARDFLQGVITQDIDRVADGKAAFAALLTPQGKLLFDFFIAAGDDGLLIDCDAGAAEALARRLKMYKLRARVAIDMLDGWSVAAAPSFEDGGRALIIEDPRLDALGLRAIGPIDALPAGETRAAYDARRIAAGAPEFGADFSSEDVFPLDVNYDALHGVDYKKGCFVGQEVASRMKRKWEVRKRTAIIDSEHSALESNAPLTADGATIGTVLSVRGSQGLALVRLDRLEKAARDALRAGDAPVRLTIPSYLEGV